jgi:hypothetical protein
LITAESTIDNVPTRDFRDATEKGTQRFSRDGDIRGSDDADIHENFDEHFFQEELDDGSGVQEELLHPSVLQESSALYDGYDANDMQPTETYGNELDMDPYELDTDISASSNFQAANDDVIDPEFYTPRKPGSDSVAASRMLQTLDQSKFEIDEKYWKNENTYDDDYSKEHANEEQDEDDARYFGAVKNPSFLVSENYYEDSSESSNNDAYSGENEDSSASFLQQQGEEVLEDSSEQYEDNELAELHEDVGDDAENIIERGNDDDWMEEDQTLGYFFYISKNIYYIPLM